MKPILTHENLMEIIRLQGTRAREFQQVRRRLHTLLPERLRQIKRDRQGGGVSAGMAERQALTDPQYLAAVEEYLTILGDGLSCQIQFETHMMLLDARRSLRAWHRP